MKKPVRMVHMSGYRALGLCVEAHLAPKNGGKHENDVISEVMTVSTENTGTGPRQVT